MLAKFRAESRKGSWNWLTQAERRMIECAGVVGCLMILASGFAACSSKSGSPTPVLVSDASADKPTDGSVWPVPGPIQEVMPPSDGPTSARTLKGE